MANEITASDPTVIPAVTEQIFSRWRIREFKFTVDPRADGFRVIDTTAELRKGNDGGFSPLPDDVLRLRVPDLLMHTGGDPVKLQRIAQIESLILDLLTEEMEARGVK